MGDQAFANSTLQSEGSLLQATDDAVLNSHDLAGDDTSYHEPTEEELRHSLLIFYIFLFVVVFAQSGLVHWRKKHKRSYELVTLIGMWIVWAMFSGVTGYLLYRCTFEKTMDKSLPKMIYRWFYGVFKVSVAIGVSGYVLLLVNIFLFAGVVPPELDTTGWALIAVWYGLYFGILTRDCAEVASDRIANRLGGPRRMAVSVRDCAICGGELKDAMQLTLLGGSGGGANDNTNGTLGGGHHTHVGLNSGLDDGEKSIQLSCKHIFHKDCLRGWLIVGKKDTCPTCSERVDLRQLYADKPWETRNIQWIQMLDFFRYLIVWQPALLVAMHFVLHVLHLDEEEGMVGEGEISGAGALNSTTTIGDSRQRSPSPALITLLEAAEDAACSFQCDARPTLRPLVLSALEATAPATPDSAPAVDDLKQVVLSLGWDPDRLDFSRPLDARDFIHRLKAACLSNLHLAGEGSYSMVFRALNNLDGKQVTLKKLRMDSSADGLSPTAVREISLLKELSSCPHVVKILDVMYDRTCSSNPSARPRVWLVLEHLDMDLAEYVKRSPSPLEGAFIRSAMHQLLLALEAVHAHRVIHRDVKPQNILIDREKQEIKLADFGLSRTCLPAPCGSRAMTQEVVTLLYRAPEVLLGCNTYSFPIDMWSAGCVLAELVIGNPLFKGDSEICQLYEIFQLIGTPDDSVWPEVTSLPNWQPLFPKWQPVPLAERLGNRLDPLGVDLLSKLLQPDPQQRPTAAEALRHPYFAALH
ncbi:hypothetical protein KSW81_001246 [Nannochloris sp. 'desiccata']|nr:hypothetical protein KSW81_001246 [Chlorella desiccata (nom. nud.)]